MSVQSSWRHDIPASIAVFLIAVPLGLGIAAASGAPPFAGIIAGVVGGLVVGALSGSQLMVSGPAAGLTSVVLAGITELGTFDVFLMAVVLAGVLQMGLGAVRAGIIGYYFPTAVIKGMLAAVGLILVLKQIPHALGYDVDTMGDVAFLQANHENTFSAIAAAVAHVEWGAVIVSATGLALLIAWRRLAPARATWLPAALAVVLMGIALNAVFTTFVPQLALRQGHLVDLPTPTSFGAFLSLFQAPDFAAVTNPAVWRVAVLLAVVASLKTLLSLEATDKMDPFKREAPTDRELYAQGAGNIVAGLIGGIPIAGVIVRSAANIEAGARSRRATVLQGALLLVAAAFLPVLVNRIPLAALAALLIHLGAQLCGPAVIRRVWARGRTHAIPFAITLVAIVLTDLLTGILVGLAMGVFFILRDHLASPPFTQVSPAGAVLRRLQLHDSLNYLHKASLLTELEAVPPGSRLEIDGRGTRRIDPDVLEVIHNFKETAALRDIDYRLVGIPPLVTTTEHAVPATRPAPHGAPFHA